MKTDYFPLAFGNLKHRGLRSYLTMLGIFIGIAAVVSLISVGDGLKLAVNSQFGISSTQVLTVQAGGLSGYGPPGTGVVNPLTKEDVDAINKLGSVQMAIRRNIATIKMYYNKKLVIGYAGSIPDDKTQRDEVYKVLDVSTFSGKLLDTDRKKVVIGYDLSDPDKNGFGKALKVGDKITLNNQSYEIAGILNKKGSFIIDKVVLILNSEMENLVGYGDKADIIAVIAKDQNSLTRAKADIENLLRERRNVKKGEEDFSVSTPDALLGTVNQILFGVQIFIVMIASISIVVGAVGIANTMITSILERKKEIGTMKAVGARNSDIFYIFAIEAGMLGLVGGIVGVIFGSALGYFGTLGISSLIGSNITPNINFPLIFFALLGSTLLGIVSGLIPAMRAAQLNPVSALRG